MDSFLSFSFDALFSCFLINPDLQSTDEFDHCTIESYNLGSSPSDWSKASITCINSTAPKPPCGIFNFSLARDILYGRDYPFSVLKVSRVIEGPSIRQ